MCCVWNYKTIVEANILEYQTSQHADSQHLDDRFLSGKGCAVTHFISVIFGQQHIPDVEGRVGSVDTGIFIHAVVPRHVETVVLMTKTE